MAASARTERTASTGPTDGDAVGRPLPRRLPARIRISHLEPTVDGGRYPAKAAVGDTLTCSADIVRDGHEVLRAVLRWRRPGTTRWSETPMRHVDAASAGVRWVADLTVDEVGPWSWTVRSWVDPVASWLAELDRKVVFGQEDLDSELAEGAALLTAAAGRATGSDRRVLSEAAATVAVAARSTADRTAAALTTDVAEAAERAPDRSRAAQAPLTADLWVDPTVARFGAWYELFPRSWGGLDGVRRRLPALAELGFDVVYLPPIHPIGRTNRKGRNNALVAGPDEPGSPWAIGDATGGHTAVHADLGTIDDVEALVRDARALGLEIALDFAIQCSADHPWLTEHPEWFFRRPDGTLKYAENPPKKYQDIYNLDFDCDDWQALWTALHDVVRCWVDRGVRVFRVDNPHTKSLPFWEWLIASIRDREPEVIFLAEAFTYRAMMQQLAKLGFDQSYTYFTWKTSKWELTEYVTELASSGEQHYFRPNFFVNTPDILTEQLAHGTPSTFASRLVLAATLSPSYGVYSGYEHFERAQRPGSEEYLDNEKYEVKHRTLDGPLLPLIADLNRIRRETRALQHLPGIRFLDTGNEALIAYAKPDPTAVGDPESTVVCVVNMDGHHEQVGLVDIPWELGLPEHFVVEDLLLGGEHRWHVGGNYVRLPADGRPAHILRVRDAAVVG